jgi:hypothetical protein
VTTPYRENQEQSANLFQSIPTAKEMQVVHENLIAGWKLEGRKMARNQSVLQRIMPSILAGLRRDLQYTISNVYQSFTQNFSERLDNVETLANIEGICEVLEEEFRARGYQTERVKSYGFQISVP